MDFDQIQKLMDKLEASKLTKLAIKQGEFELTLEKQVAERVVLAPPSSARAPEHHDHSVSHEKKSSPQHSGAVVKSPMVGTFYQSPAPNEPKFVNLNDMVSKGQVICIIEAMKVMNEIKADSSGRLVEVLAEDGQSVEFGQPLYRIEHA